MGFDRYPIYFTIEIIVTTYTEVALSFLGQHTKNIYSHYLGGIKWCTLLVIFCGTDVSQYSWYSARCSSLGIHRHVNWLFLYI